MSLIQDIVYRNFLYNKYDWQNRREGNLEKLYNDYRLINSYVVDKYNLVNDIIIPDNLKDEAISKIYPFGIENMVEELKDDFKPYHEGHIEFFTKDMADEYIKQATEVCLNELEAMDNGKAYMDEYKWSWSKKVESLLETTENTRELGGYRTNKGTYTKCNSILRSDLQKCPSQKDIDYLLDNHITTIIDMRGSAEVERVQSGLSKVDGLHYYNFQLDEGSGIPESVEAVPDSYINIACGKNIPKVFKCIAEAEEGVIFNCTAGKDRTGIVSTVLLKLCGVSDEDIIENYMITKACITERFKHLHEKFPDMDMNIVIPNENNMITLFKFLKDKFGSVEGYLKNIGLTTEQIHKIKEKLM